MGLQLALKGWSVTLTGEGTTMLLLESMPVLLIVHFTQSGPDHRRPSHTDLGVEVLEPTEAQCMVCGTHHNLDFLCGTQYLPGRALRGSNETMWSRGQKSMCVKAKGFSEITGLQAQPCLSHNLCPQEGPTTSEPDSGSYQNLGLLVGPRPN